MMTEETYYLDTWSQKRPGSSPSNLQQSVMALIASLTGAVGSVSGLDPAKLALWIDVSHWNKITQAGLQKAVAAGLVGLVTKASDGKQMIKGSSYDLANYVDDTLHANIQSAYNLGIPCLVYHYFQPDLPQAGSADADWQFKCLKKAIGALPAGKSYHGIVIDIEEKTDSAPNIAGKVLKFYRWIREDPEFSKVKTLIYTSSGYLDFCTNLREQISFKGAAYDLWLAQWVITGKATSAAGLKDLYPQINMRVITPGYATWQFLQWGVVTLAEFGGAIDCNFFKGDKAASYAFVGYQPAGQEDPGDPADPGDPVDPADPGDPVVPGTGADLTALTARVAAVESQVQALQAWQKKIRES